MPELEPNPPPSELETLLSSDEARAVLDAIFCSIPAGMVIVRAPDGKLLRVSDYSARLFEASRDDVEGRRTLAEEFRTRVVVHDPSGRRLPESEWPVARALRGETVSGFEARVGPIGGELCPVNINAAPIRNARGDVVGAISSVADLRPFKALEGELRQALAQREAMYRELTAVVNSVDQIIWTSRPDGCVDFFNRRCYELTGAAPGSLEGDAWIEQLIHPDDRARTAARWRRHIATGEPYEVEYRVRHHSGAWRWMLQRARPVRNEAGEIIRWMGACTDIQAQKEYAERYRQLHEANPAPHVVLARDLTIQEASQSFLQAAMTRREDLIGRRLDEAFPGNPEDPDAARAAATIRASHERVLETGRPDRVPVQKFDIRRPSGEYETRWWSFLSVPVLGLDGEVRHILHQVEDLTGEMVERQKAAEARAAEERFRAVAETIPAPVFEADAAARLTYCNRKFLAYTGLTLQQMREDRTRHIHPDDRERDEAMIADIQQNPRTHQIELRYRRADGAYHWFLTQTSPLFDAEGRLEKWIGVAIDVTEQREAAELQRTLMQEVSHRVKNSLAIISSLLRLQARPLEGEARQALEQASLRVHAVARVHDLLWRMTGPREIDVQSFLSDLSSALASCSPRHKTVCSFEPAVAGAEIAVPLGLVLNELLTNAYKYAYPEGQEGPGGVAGEVRVRGAREPDGRYRLEVSDSGVGLPPGFDFARRGESLGMKVITSMAAQLGAELSAQSVEPGARFTLVFPLDSGCPATS